MKECINIMGIIAVLLTAIISCKSSGRNFIGKYGAEGYRNNYDTIWLEKGGKYKRKFIQKTTGEIFTQEGNWVLKEGKERSDISLQPFFRNEDIKEIDDTIFRSLSYHGTVLMVKEGLFDFKLLQNGDLGWYYNKVE